MCDPECWRCEHCQGRWDEADGDVLPAICKVRAHPVDDMDTCPDFKPREEE